MSVLTQNAHRRLSSSFRSAGLSRYDAVSRMRVRPCDGAISLRLSALDLQSGQSGPLQQGPSPAVGLISSTSPQAYASRIAAFNRGLEEAGYTDGKNVTIEYRPAFSRQRRPVTDKQA